MLFVDTRIEVFSLPLGDGTSVDPIPIEREKVHHCRWTAEVAIQAPCVLSFWKGWDLLLPGGSYSLLIFLWHHFSFTLEHPVRAS
jgi:hypothetical protein